MKIEIWVDDVEPPTGGAVRAVGGTAGDRVPFVGWLGLLRVLSELLAAERPAITDEVSGHAASSG